MGWYVWKGPALCPAQHSCSLGMGFLSFSCTIFSHDLLFSNPAPAETMQSVIDAIFQMKLLQIIFNDP